ncbi:hypothetical protein LCGC14_1583330, partial [marine sediment metagenome]
MVYRLFDHLEKPWYSDFKVGPETFDGVRRAAKM